MAKSATLLMAALFALACYYNGLSITELNCDPLRHTDFFTVE